MRLTHKKEDWCWKDEEFWLSAENPSLEKSDEIYYKLAEFEDFMEEQGFESLGELKSTVSNIEKLMLIAAKTTNLEQENQALKARWEKLKEYVNTPKEFQEWREEMEITVDSIKAKMQELEEKC